MHYCVYFIVLFMNFQTRKALNQRILGLFLSAYKLRKERNKNSPDNNVINIIELYFFDFDDFQSKKLF